MSTYLQPNEVANLEPVGICGFVVDHPDNSPKIAERCRNLIFFDAPQKTAMIALAPRTRRNKRIFLGTEYVIILWSLHGPGCLVADINELYRMDIRLVRYNSTSFADPSG